jgi:type IV pilus assembly protein PilE
MQPFTQCRHKGFTLIEVLIAMSIVGILTALAIPSYRSSTTSARRIDAQLALLHIQVAQEQHYATHLRFASSLSANGTTENLGLSQVSSGGDYGLGVATAPDGQSFVATAQPTPLGRQRHDQQCMTLSIDSTGWRRSANLLGEWIDAPSACWR